MPSPLVLLAFLLPIDALLAPPGTALALCAAAFLFLLARRYLATQA